MKINDLSYNATGARYGYNSQEQSIELNLDGNHTTAEFWEYDARSARRWNLDPVVKHHSSGYNTFASNPIMYNDLRGDKPGDRFKTQHEAAIDFGKYYNGESIIMKKEFVSAIFINNDKGVQYYSYGQPKTGEKDKIKFRLGELQTEEGSVITALIHTHAHFLSDFDNGFSEKDIETLKRTNLEGYLCSPMGVVWYASKEDVLSKPFYLINIKENIISLEIPSDNNPENKSRVNNIDPFKGLKQFYNGNSIQSDTPADNTQVESNYIMLPSELKNEGKK